MFSSNSISSRVPRFGFTDPDSVTEPSELKIAGSALTVGSPATKKDCIDPMFVPATLVASKM